MEHQGTIVLTSGRLILRKITIADINAMYRTLGNRFKKFAAAYWKHFCCRYYIRKKWWHMGYTSEALKTIMPFLFLEVKANRLESQHDPNNPNSGAVMKKFGLNFEGTLRSAGWNSQGIVDAAMYSVLAKDFKTDSIR